MKAMIAHILLTYEFELADETLSRGQLPPVGTFGTNYISDSSTEVMFRLRKE